MTLKQYSYILGAGVVLFIIGYSTGKYFTKPQIQEKIVYKETETKQDNISTTTTTTKHPDGTETTVTQQIDKSVENTNISNTTQVSTVAQPQWHAALGAGYNFRTVNPVYIGSIDKRLLGPISVGAFGVSDGTVGVTLGLSF